MKNLIYYYTPYETLPLEIHTEGRVRLVFAEAMGDYPGAEPHQVLRLELDSHDPSCRVEIRQIGQDEEGYSHHYLKLEQQMGQWEIAQGFEGRDCDGRVSSGRKAISTGEPDPNTPAWLPGASLLAPRAEWRRDLAAESAGY